VLAGTWAVEDTLVAEDTLPAGARLVVDILEEDSQAVGTLMVGLSTAGLLDTVDQVWGVARLVAESHLDFAGHPF
jgi:hypothetical protein